MGSRRDFLSLLSGRTMDASLLSVYVWVRCLWVGLLQRMKVLLTNLLYIELWVRVLVRHLGMGVDIRAEHLP